MTFRTYGRTLQNMKGTIQIRLEPEKRKQLEKLAKESGHTISSYVRWLLEKDFEKENKK